MWEMDDLHRLGSQNEPENDGRLVGFRGCRKLLPKKGEGLCRKS